MSRNIIVAAILMSLPDVIAETYWFRQAEMWSLVAIWGAAALVPALLFYVLIRCLFTEWKKRAKRGTDIQSLPGPGDDTYTALNQMTMSPVYDTLQNVQDPANDTYSALNPATISSNYDTLKNVKDPANNTYSTLNPATMSSDYDTLRK
ncbi:uncharacterized protein Hap1MRO34_004519 isoform 2-T2 [Clarias gariepinus]